MAITCVVQDVGTLAHKLLIHGALARSLGTFTLAGGKGTISTNFQINIALSTQLSMYALLL